MNNFKILSPCKVKKSHFREPNEEVIQLNGKENLGVLIAYEAGISLRQITANNESVAFSSNGRLEVRAKTVYEDKVGKFIKFGSRKHYLNMED
ncbi:hypothetical protein G7062_11365 [Erysipelothrix sp. HDW6C]|uniref:hypothetical protein n=1 Tax=Erysipelothrix sp. HDW6C TaxID=2714930 RepID=UPI00140C22DA|nr:hypothetical protein [Erysipelothrix sp. HDW6C]QIK70856.1 hypothetical protein G7062_11365 [Erysipelothrix sp. HDW6C]